MYEALTMLVDLWNDLSIFLQVEYGLELDQKQDFASLLENLEKSPENYPLSIDPRHLHRISKEMFRHMTLGFSKEHDLSMETFLKNYLKKGLEKNLDFQKRAQVEGRLKRDKHFLNECMLLTYFELSGQNRVIFDKNFEIVEAKKNMSPVLKT